MSKVITPDESDDFTVRFQEAAEHARLELLRFRDAIVDLCNKIGKVIEKIDEGKKGA